MKRIILRIVAAVLLLVGLGAAGFFGYWGYFRHLNSQFNALVYTEDFKARENIDVSAARAALHRILDWPYYGWHDAYLFASSLGDETTVPLLIECLEHQGDIEKGDIVDCTRGHLISALRDLTGADPGLNYSDWKEWYKNNR